VQTVVDWLMNYQLFKHNSAPGSWLVGWFNNSPHAVPLYAKQTRRGGGSIALPPLDFGAGRVWVDNTTLRQLYLQEGDWVFILQEAE